MNQNIDRIANEKMGSALLNIPVAANVQITEATMVVLNAEGYAVEASKTENQTIAGIAVNYADNRNGEAGAILIRVKRGTFILANDGTIKTTDLLKDCYIKDKETVTITSTGTSKAGKIIEVETDHVAVEIQ